MPMKWTLENDQRIKTIQLLLKILEVHNLSVDTKKVAEAWPTVEGQDRPTARAITERLVRLRQMVKSNTGGSSAEGHFSIGGGLKNVPSTPRKQRKGVAGSTPGSGSSLVGSGKRKRGLKGEDGDDSTLVKIEIDEDVDGEYEEEEADDEVEEIDTPTKKKTSSLAAVKNEGQVQVQKKEVKAGSTLGLGSLDLSDLSDIRGAIGPAGKTWTRRATTLRPGFVNYTLVDSDEDGKVGDADFESSASEYVPEGSFETGRDDG